MGQELIDRMKAFLRQYVVLSDAQALLLALWCIHTWVYDRFGATPYLEIMATTKRGGKTTAGELLAMLSQNGKMFATIRPLTIVRMILAYEGRVTVFIDEAEKLASATLNETRTMLATGYRKGAMHAVSVGQKFVEFPTYCPKAFMLIGNIQDVLRDRCIPIYLERATPSLILANNRDAAEEQAGELVATLVEVFRHMRVPHGADNKPRFPLLDPAWLTSPRDREIWTPLFSVAQAMSLHKGTMDTLTAASVDFSSLKLLPRREYHSAQDETTADDIAAAAHVLRDVQACFLPDETAIRSTVLIERLRAINTSPWRSWRGPGLDAIMLAALLSRYGVEPMAIQFGKGRRDREVAKGYKRVDVMRAKP